MMCQGLKSLAVRYCLPSLLKPLLTCQNIAPFLKVLKLVEWQHEELLDICKVLPHKELLEICKVLPSLTALQHFQLIRGLDLDEGPSPPGLPMDSWIQLLSYLPQTLRALSLETNNEEELKYLSTFLARNGLPNLTELYLYEILLEGKIEVVKHLRHALQTSAGQRLKKLWLNIREHQDEELSWQIYSSMLGLGFHEGSEEAFPRLEVLILGHIDWLSLGHHLLNASRFPKLAEVRVTECFEDKELEIRYLNHDAGLVSNFYEVDTDTSRLWLYRVLPLRPTLRPVKDGQSVCFRSFQMESEPSGEEIEYRNDLVKELLIGLSQPFVAHTASCIREIDICCAPLDCTMCHALTQTIRSQNMVALETLQFLVLDRSCSAEELVPLGGVLHHGLLPRLRELCLGTASNLRNQEPGPFPLVNCWQAFFQAIPEDGLCQLRVFKSGVEYRNRTLKSVSRLFTGLAALRPQPALMASVSVLDIHDRVNAADLRAIIACLSAFPSLECIKLRGQCTYGFTALWLTPTTSHVGTPPHKNFGKWRCPLY